jgi:hypothetical protein
MKIISETGVSIIICKAESWSMYGAGWMRTELTEAQKGGVRVQRDTATNLSGVI